MQFVSIAASSEYSRNRDYGRRQAGRKEICRYASSMGQGRGISGGAWFAMLIVAALSLAGCVTVPHLGWAGWLLVGVIYWLAARTEAAERRIADLEDDADGPPSD
jgi:hypothetical protein